MQEHRVVIIGGGFGGIRAALDLSKNKQCKVTLVSVNENFEYYPGLHKLLGVHEYAVASVPLKTIFEGKAVELLYDKVTSVDTATKTVVTEKQTLQADSIIIAVGSQTEYFGIAGLKEMAFGFKSVAEATRLRAHIETMFQKHAHTDKAESVIGLHVVVVGAGPNGVDLSGELAVFAKYLAKKYAVTESLVTIDLIEAAPRILAMLPEKVSKRVDKRLRDLGVNVLCNRDMKEHESWTVDLADMTIGTKTVIWTAGISTNELVKSVSGLTLGKRNRVAVDSYLQPTGIENVYCIGDAADTQYAGLAQTALLDGEFVADVIIRKLMNKPLRAYVPEPNAFNIGAGPCWSVMMVGSFVSYGLFPYLFRTLIDIKFFLSILPVSKVYRLYFPKSQ